MFCMANSVERQRLSKSRMLFLSSCVVACQGLSFLSTSFVICLAMSSGMDVNSDATSQDTMVSPVSS